MAHVMVLDDEPNICWAFRNFLDDDGHRVTIASSAEQALERVAADPPDVLFLDIRLPGLDGFAALDQIRGRCPRTPVIVMTAYGTMQTAVRAVRAGAFDYLPKPFDLAQARRLVERALQAGQAPTQPREPQPGRLAAGEMVGCSLPMQAVFKQVALAAASSVPVLITGESGTGKELVARAIHQHGERADRPFVPVHLAAMPEGLVERELFGHERGAYTGADLARPGLLDQAGSGTVFFDEVAETPAPIQAKLLRVLDGAEYRPVGGGAEKTLRARIIAATNRELAACVGSGSFRADLFYRLAVLTIHLPPLRERRDDVLPLWDTFVARLMPQAFQPIDPGSDLAARLLAHDWPGNVRELRNAAEYAARASQSAAIHPEHLPATVGSAPAPDDRASAELEAAAKRWAELQLHQGDEAESGLLERLQNAVERPLLEAAAAWAAGNQVRMARRLGLHRTTLRLKLRQHGLEPPKRD